MGEPATRYIARSQHLRICMISDDFYPARTGVGVQLQHVSAELARRGHAVSVITSRSKGDVEREVHRGVTVYRANSLRVAGYPQALPGKRMLARILREQEPDILHQHYPSMMAIQAAAVARAQGLRQIYTYHVGAEVFAQLAMLRPMHGVIHRTILGLCNTSDLVLAPSRPLTQKLPSMGVTRPCRFISNPVALGAATHHRTSSDTPFVVLYVGRLEPEKNVGYLLRGFAGLAQQRRDVELRIVGQGSMERSLRSTAARLGVADRVQFVGQVAHEQIADIYATAHAFVLPSLHETQSLVVLEAMSSGLPAIVTSSIVSAPDLVTDGENGFIVDPNSPEELTERLGRLAACSELREALGEASRERARPWSLESVIDETESAYWWTLSKNKSTNPDGLLATPTLGAA